jgi:arylsulfatase A-like enzyme
MKTGPGVVRGKVCKKPVQLLDVYPTLLNVAGLEKDAKLEGHSIAALIMSVSPFGGYSGGKAFRGKRTTRYTYVRSTDGPWLLYDNKTDPYQMENLIGKAAHAGLQKELEGKLQAKLTETGDAFVSKQEYLKTWGYRVDEHGTIPSARGHMVQSPANKPR